MKAQISGATIADRDQLERWRDAAGYARCLTDEASQRGVVIRDNSPRWVVSVEPPGDAADAALKLAGVIILLAMALGMGLSVWL